MNSSTYDPRLVALLQNLRELPAYLSDHPNIYPFPGLVLDPSDVVFYGTPQGALNHRLELVFGPRHENQPIQLKGRGPSLEAIVDVLHHHLTGEAGENVLLWNWVEDLTRAAQEHNRSPILKTEDGVGHKRRAPAGKLAATPRKRKNKGSRARTDAAKARTAIKYSHNPADLEDDTLEVHTIGHPRDELLDKLTIPCHSIIDPSHRRVRCRSVGCGWSCAEPQTTGRVLKHARVCPGLDVSLRQEIVQRGASLSLAARLRERIGSVNEDESAVDDLEARQLKTEKVNHALLKLICDRMLAPSIVNCTKWHEFVHALDESITTASGNTISENFVTTEATYIRSESIKALSNLSNLTLSFDGGTTRGGESIYTVHVTDPVTRDAYLIEGNEALGVSHTGEHIEAILDRVITEIGPRRFACVVSDNAGNTRAARALPGQKYPWMVTLLDACHQQNNTAKDIGHLSYFRACISQLKSIITFFHSSSFARRHLAALCVLNDVHGGLEADGRTRFVSIYYAARSVLRCITQILELFSSGVLEPKSNSPVYWLLDLLTVQKFITELRQLVVVLESLARSIKCLESSHSTPADVYHFWLAVLARYNDLFKGNTTLLGSALPASVINDIRSIVNGRYSEMFRNSSQQIYVTAFFLDFRFRGADIFRNHSQHRFLPPGESVSATSQASLADIDLRRAIPAYTKAGEYLLQLLAHIYNANPTLPLFFRYNNAWKDIELSLREQLMRFIRCLSPFHRSSEAATSRQYWEEMSTVPGADLLAHLGVLINSLVPNLMAKERTMLVITKMNSPDRASQKVSTLFDMTLIRQYYKREENSMLNKRHSRPTVRFADLSKHLDIPTIAALPHPSDPSADAPGHNTSRSVLLYQGVDELELEAESVDYVQPGRRDVFEAETLDGIYLASKLLTDILTDVAPSAHASQSLSSVTTPPMQSQMHQPVDVSKLVY